MELTKEREIIRNMAETILDRVHDPKADSATMINQCEQAVKLAKAEYKERVCAIGLPQQPALQNG